MYLFQDFEIWNKLSVDIIYEMSDHKVSYDHQKDAVMGKFYMLLTCLCIYFLSLENSWAQTDNCNQFLIAADIKQPFCGILNDGMITLKVSGGKEPYAFEWSDGSKLSEVKVSEGDYFVQVTDANGCQATKTFSIATKQKLLLNVVTTNPTTPQASDGQIQCSFLGGSSPYHLQVSHYTATNSVNRYTTDQAILNELEEGRYILDVIDSRGCVSTATVVLSSQNK